MDTPNEEEAMMAAYLIHKHSYFKNNLLFPLKVLFLEESRKDLAKILIITEFCTKLGVSPESAEMFTNNINVEDLLK